MINTNAIVVLSGGAGSRFSQTSPKQLAMLAGKPILQHTLEQVMRVKEIDEVVVVYNPSTLAQTQGIISELKCDKK